MKKYSVLFAIVALVLALLACQAAAPSAPVVETVPTIAPEATDAPVTPICSLTDAEMARKVGLPQDVKPVFHGEGVSWDHCQWQWQAYDVGSAITLPLPAGFLATVTHTDGVVAVYRGKEGLKIPNVAGFNIRYTVDYAPDHWVQSDCFVLQQEMAFGSRRSPSYETVSGNLVCKDLASFSVSSCPVNTAQVAALIGGTADQWTAPDWEKGAWVFKAQKDEFIILKVPASLEGAADVVQLDYWNGSTSAPDSFYPGEGGIGLNEASLHCHAK